MTTRSPAAFFVLGVTGLLLAGCASSTPTDTSSPPTPPTPTPPTSTLTAARPGLEAAGRPTGLGGQPALALIDRLEGLNTVTRDQLLAATLAVKTGGFPSDPGERATVAGRLELASAAYAADRLAPATYADLAAVLVRAAEGYPDPAPASFERLRGAGVLPEGAQANQLVPGRVVVAGLIALADRLAAHEPFPGGPERELIVHSAEAPVVEPAPAPAPAATVEAKPATVQAPAEPAPAPAVVPAAATTPTAAPAPAPAPAPAAEPAPVPPPPAAPATPPAPKPNPWTPGTPLPGRPG